MPRFSSAHKAFDGVGVTVAVHVPVLALDNGVEQYPGHAEITRR